MVAVLYRCPDTGLNVQGWLADDGAANRGEVYEAMTCQRVRAGAFGEPSDLQGLGAALVGAREQRRRHVEAEHECRLGIDNELELG
jgi:hypothetical protein